MQKVSTLHDALFLKVPEWVLDHWHPSEKAMYPDYFSKREQWKKLRMQSWDKEVGCYRTRFTYRQGTRHLHTHSKIHITVLTILILKK